MSCSELIDDVYPGIIYSKKPLPRQYFLPWWTLYKSWKWDKGGTIEEWEKFIFNGVNKHFRIKENLYVAKFPLLGKTEPDIYLQYSNFIFLVPIKGIVIKRNKKTGLYPSTSLPTPRIDYNTFIKRSLSFDSFPIVNRCKVIGYLVPQFETNEKLDKFNKDFSEELRFLINKK